MEHLQPQQIPQQRQSSSELQPAPLESSQNSLREDPKLGSLVFDVPSADAAGSGRRSPAAPPPGALDSPKLGSPRVDTEAALQSFSADAAPPDPDRDTLGPALGMLSAQPSFKAPKPPAASVGLAEASTFTQLTAQLAAQPPAKPPAKPSAQQSPAQQSPAQQPPAVLLRPLSISGRPASISGVKGHVPAARDRSPTAAAKRSQVVPLRGRALMAQLELDARASIVPLLSLPTRLWLNVDKYGQTLPPNIRERERVEADGWKSLINAQRLALWKLMTEPEHSLAAHCVSILIVATIVVSTVGFCLETLPVYQEDRSPEAHRTLVVIEAVTVQIFMAEYLLKLISCESIPRFVIQPLSIIDLVAVVPWYVQLALSDSGVQGTAVFRVLRLMRVFRMLKLGSRYEKLSLVVRTLVLSLDMLVLMTFFVSIIVVVAATLMFFAERGSYDEALGYYVRDNEKYLTADGNPIPSPFESIPAGFWWSIVTLMTVGYGDVVPVSAGGRVIAMTTMVLGILSIALPVAVIGANFSSVWEEYLRQHAAAAASQVPPGVRRLAAALGQHCHTVQELEAIMKQAVSELSEELLRVRLREELRHQEVGALLSQHGGELSREQLAAAWRVVACLGRLGQDPEQAAQQRAAQEVEERLAELQHQQHQQLVRLPLPEGKQFVLPATPPPPAQQQQPAQQLLGQEQQGQQGEGREEQQPQLQLSIQAEDSPPALLALSSLPAPSAAPLHAVTAAGPSRTTSASPGAEPDGGAGAGDDDATASRPQTASILPPGVIMLRAASARTRQRGSSPCSRPGSRGPSAFGAAAVAPTPGFGPTIRGGSGAGADGGVQTHSSGPGLATPSRTGSAFGAAADAFVVGSSSGGMAAPVEHHTREGGAGGSGAVVVEEEEQVEQEAKPEARSDVVAELQEALEELRGTAMHSKMIGEVREELDAQKKVEQLSEQLDEVMHAHQLLSSRYLPRLVDEMRSHKRQVDQLEEEASLVGSQLGAMRKELGDMEDAMSCGPSGMLERLSRLSRTARRSPLAAHTVATAQAPRGSNPGSILKLPSHAPASADGLSGYPAAAASADVSRSTSCAGQSSAANKAGPSSKPNPNPSSAAAAAAVDPVPLWSPSGNSFFDSPQTTPLPTLSVLPSRAASRGRVA